MSGHADQAEALRTHASSLPKAAVPRGLRCIAVGSGKGGVGKTAVSVGLSFCLARQGKRVLLLDADLGLANVDIQMGLDPDLTMQDVVFGHCALEDIVVRTENGPDVLPASSGAIEMADLGDARRRMLVDELIRFARGYDFMIVDAGAGVGRGVTTFLNAVPEVLVVAANEPTSLMDSYSLIKLLHKGANPPHVMIVMNMLRTLEEGEVLAGRLNGIVKRFMNMNLPVAGMILFDEAVRASIRSRRSVIEHAPASAATDCMKDLSNYILKNRQHLTPNRQLREGFFDRLAHMSAKQEKMVS